MRILVLGLIAGFALAPLTALAADSMPGIQTVSVTPTSDQIVCHYYFSHGMVIRNPDCHPLRFWAWRRHQLQDDIRQFQLRSLTKNN